LISGFRQVALGHDVAVRLVLRVDGGVEIVHDLLAPESLVEVLAEALRCGRVHQLAARPLVQQARDASVLRVEDSFEPRALNRVVRLRDKERRRRFGGGNVFKYISPVAQRRNVLRHECGDLRRAFQRVGIGTGDAGALLGALVPPEFGGPGAEFSEIFAICHLLGRYCASTAMIYAMHQIQLACILLHARGADWHGKLLARLAGEQRVAGRIAGIGFDLQADRGAGAAPQAASEIVEEVVDRADRVDLGQQRLRIPGIVPICRVHVDGIAGSFLDKPDVGGVGLQQRVEGYPDFTP